MNTTLSGKSSRPDAWRSHGRRTTARAAHVAMATSLLAGLLVVGTTHVVQAAPLVTGTIVNDANADGVPNSALGTGAETGLGGATVELLDGAGNPIDPDGAGPLANTITTTAADGTYSLDAQADGTYIVRVTAPAGYIVGMTGSGGITRTSPTVGDSAPIVLTGLNATVDALLRPDFVLQLGYLNNPDGIITGSAPFDTADAACSPDPGPPTVPTILNDTTTPPGVDCTKYDDNVRSGDNVSFNFSISGSADDDSVDTVADVVVQQTITPKDGAVINFARIPLACIPPSGGSGGTPPPMSKVEYFDGTNWVDYTGAGYSVPQDLPAAALGAPLRLTCNKGIYSTGDASTLGTTVRVDGTSPNGSSFESEARVFAADNDGNATAVPDGPLAAPPIEIKARPEWDLRKGGFYNQSWTTYDPDGAGPLPSTAGFFTYFNIMLGADRKAGNEPLAQPIVLKDQLWAFEGDGTTPHALSLGSDYFYTGCYDFWPDRFGGYSNQVFSNGQEAYQPPYLPNYTPDMGVAGSGTCSVNGTTGDITLNNIDFGGPYPTKTTTNQSLTAGPYLVANKWVQVWMPLSTLDNFDNVLGNESGSGFLWNRINNFDPNGISGNSNYGDGVEPGWCDGTVAPTVDTSVLPAKYITGCAELPQGDLLTGQTRSNDVAGPTSFVFSPGYYSKYLLKPNGNERSYVNHDDSGYAHDGNGTIQPGQYTSTWLHWIAVASNYENPTQCDIWDNSMLQLVPLTEANVSGNIYGISSSLYATSTGAGTDPALLKYEFAHIPITGDDPLVGGLNGATGRYDGNWADLKASNCDESGVVWSTDPNLVGTGIDDVNAVRVTGPGADDLTPATPTMSPGSDRLLRVGYKARDVFYGGPHAGQPIPASAVGANYGKIKSSNLSTGNGAGGYNLPSYEPSPENASTDGDRVTWTRAVFGIKKRTIALDGLCDSPCAAAIDTNGAVLAGQQVVWEMLPVVNASSSQPAPVPNVVIKDVLPVYVEYDDACTAALTGGTPADDVQLNTPGPGQTTLIWNYASVQPNVAMAPLRICTGTDPLAPAPQSVTNRVEMSSTAIPTSHPFDTHTLTLEQSGDLKLRKTVDAPLDVLNDDQLWTISYANFSETVSVQPIRTIEVFPYNGDGSPPSGPTRNPASNYDGALKLTATIAPKYADGTTVPGTAYYSGDAPGTIQQDWNVNTSTWCTTPDNGATFVLAIGLGTCPTTLNDVTAWMFAETSNLVPTSDPNKNRVNIPFTLQAGDPVAPLSVDANKPNNVYTDRFTAFSNTFVKNGLPQRLSSNTVRVKTLGFTAGDFVFDDRDGDGKYTAGTDFPVPDGVTIKLYYVPATGPAVLLDTTTTSGGTYLFTDLPSGDFYVEIPASFFGVGQLLEGWSITPTPASANVEENDDVSHDAVPGTAGAVKSHTFTLSAKVSNTGTISGDEPKADSLHGVVDPTLVTDGFNNFTIDLALQSPVVSIGDRVWLDVNRDGLQTAGEPGVVGVTVQLYAANGTTLLGSTLTIADGKYSFTNLVYSTNYVVKFVLPTGQHFTTQFAGAVALDSNANVTTGLASVITPADGNNSATSPDEPTIDAGLVNIELTINKVLNTAPNFWSGKTVTYTVTPQNLGTTNALAGWSVTEVLPSQLTLVSMVGTGDPSLYSCVANVCTSTATPLAAGATGEPILVTATINAGVTGLVRNVTYVSPKGSDVPEVNPLGTPPPAGTDTDTTATNNDDHADLTVNRYDLALAKVSNVSLVALGDDVQYTITVANQGSVASGAFTVVDLVPAGLTVDAATISNGGVYNAGARTITWALAGLAATDPDSTLAVTYSVKVTDLSKRPWRNFAEIATDSGALWGGDVDSKPDTLTTNDGNYDTPGVDNASIADAGVAPDPEDDADIAELDSDLTYDLALAKVASASTINPDGTVTFTVTVENQGDVNSGDYTVTDTLPVGTAATAASDGGVITPNTVTWTLSGLAPGTTRAVTATVKIVDPAKRPFKNIAEISADGADEYDVVGNDVEDADSVPDKITDNDNGDVAGDGYGTFENPTNNIDDIALVDEIPNGEDDADVAFFDTTVLYDLALIKTGPAAINGAGTANFTITVKNQGNVPSGAFTVLDTIPTGLLATAASDGGTIAGQSVTWNLPSMNPGATVAVTVTVQVSNFTTRPWVNIAEISADGADAYDSTGYESPVDGDVEDDDSKPDSNPTNDVLVDQTVLPTDQYNDPLLDEDDHDVAPLTANIIYDLALVKVLPAGQTFKKDSFVTFNIVIKNQGNVNSGVFTVQDVIPAGLTFVSASDSPLNAGQTVSWELASLAPGAIKTLSLIVKLVDITKATYINFAEIVSDGSGQYGPGVKDKDSTPDADITNDKLVDNDDVNIDNLPGDEDDHDRALLDPAKVRSDNPESVRLPTTGSDPLQLLVGGIGLLGIGLLAVVSARRRRRVA